MKAYCQERTMNNDAFDNILGLEIEGFGSDGDDHFFFELSDGSEIEFMLNDLGELEVNYYKGFLDA